VPREGDGPGAGEVDGDGEEGGEADERGDCVGVAPEVGGDDEGVVRGEEGGGDGVDGWVCATR
jgi:hypothetical protein